MIQGFLEKHLILDLWQEINKVNLEHLVIPESNKAIQEYWNRVKRTSELIWEDLHGP